MSGSVRKLLQCVATVYFNLLPDKTWSPNSQHSTSSSGHIEKKQQKTNIYIGYIYGSFSKTQKHDIFLNSKFLARIFKAYTTITRCYWTISIENSSNEKFNKGSALRALPLDRFVYRTSSNIISRWTHFKSIALVSRAGSTNQHFDSNFTAVLI